MGIKLLAIGTAAFFSFSGSVCGKTSAEDATKEKPTPDVVMDGVDTAPLTAREKKEWSAYVSEFLSPCANVPVSISQCVHEKRDCKKCTPAAKYVLRGVKDGKTREQIEKSYKNRFEADKVKNVAIDGSPAKGAESAAITIVEFADFECPHCGELAPALDKAVEEHKGGVRFVFKFFPLPIHSRADIAARAAIAALSQGKFWEMHLALFVNQRRLEQTDLDSYAKELGLDVSRFHADMQAQATTDRIAKDKKLGEDLQVHGTPSIFINGRLYDGYQELGEWIALELQTMGAAPAAAAAVAPRKDGGVR